MDSRKAKVRFYKFWEWAGIAATIMLYLIIVSKNGGDYLGTALWFWPLMVVINFGCFASRDRKYECGSGKA